MKSRAFTDSEALGASPPLIDFVAQDVPDLLRNSTAGRSGGSTAARSPFTRPMPSSSTSRDEPAPAVPERHRASADRVSAPDPGDPRTDRGVLESGSDRAWRRRRCVSAARILRAAGPAGEHDRHASDRVRSGAAAPRIEGAELRRVGHRRHRESRHGIGHDDQDGARRQRPPAIYHPGRAVLRRHSAVPRTTRAPVAASASGHGCRRADRAAGPRPHAAHSGCGGTDRRTRRDLESRERGGARRRGLRCESWRSTA